MRTGTDHAQGVVEEALKRVSDNLGVLIHRPLALQEVTSEIATTRAAGRDQVHISFKLAFDRAGDRRHGCLLAPLPDAIAMAGFLLMLPDASVATLREEEDLGSDLKDALLELGNFVAGAVDEALRARGLRDVSVRSEGCQGVRADVRPAFPYEEGDELVVGRARARLGDFPAFDLVLMLPRLDGLG